MPKLVIKQATFDGGEISPKLSSRADTDFYSRSVKTMRNFYPLAQGGAKRRVGSRYIGAVRNSTKTVKQIPFTYSTTNTVQLIFNDGKIQFIKDHAFIETSPGVRYEISHPYTDSELTTLTYVQYGNYVFFASSTHAPRYLYRTSDTNWTLAALSFTYNAITDYNYRSAYVNFKILGGTTAFDTTSKFTFTTDGAGHVATGPTLTGAGNGVLYAVAVTASLDIAATWEIKCIYAGSDKQKWTVTRTTDSLVPTVEWSPNDYPAAVGMYQQRLFFAGSVSLPQTIWGSSSTNTYDFTLGASDSDGVAWTIASTSYDRIIHLYAASRLMVLTYGGEYALSGGPNGLTPSSVLITQQTAHGSSTVKPVRVGDEVLFVQRSQQVVRGISYDVLTNIDTAPDITLLAEHITSPGITNLAYAQSTDQVIWCVRSDGKMVSLTRYKEHDIQAWSQHDTDGLVKDVSVSPSGTYDEVYITVERTINSATVRYVEYFDYVSNLQSDCAIVLTSGTPTKSWSGLGHLEGKTVDVVADGVVHQQLTVTSGAITLLYAASTVQVGLNYESVLELLHPDANLADGSTAGRALSIHEFIMKLYATLGCRVSFNNGSTYENITFRHFNEPTDSAITPYTGDKKVSALGWRSPHNVIVSQNIPYACTVLGIVYKIMVND